MLSLLDSGQPRFRVYEEENPEGEVLVLGTKGWNLRDFSISASFDALTYAKKGVHVQITLNGWKEVWHDISGFPRKVKRHERR